MIKKHQGKKTNKHTKTTNLFYGNSFLTHLTFFFFFSFFFNRENTETIWLKNSEKKEANPGAILQLHLYGAHTNTAAEGHKKPSDQKSSLFCTGLRSYRSCKPIAR